MWGKIKRFYGRAELFFHPLVGLSSYEKYLAHMREAHPEATPKSRREFFAEFLESKYNSGKPGKCC